MTNQSPPQSLRDFDIGVARRLLKLESQLEYLKSILARGDQATDTASSVTFDSINVGNVAGAGPGQIIADKDFLSLENGLTGGFRAGATNDVQFYRSAADTWRTPDNLTVDGEITTGLVGTWTPIYSGSTIAGTFTYANQIAYYVKLGGMVHFTARVTISAIAVAPTGVMRIGGLPFAAKATHFGSAVLNLISNFNYTNTAFDLTAVIGPTNTTIDLYESFDNAGVAGVPAANFTNAACDMIVSGFYFI